MKLLTLNAKNFMPYKGTHKITFPANGQQNVMLVFGDNMRGKTSFLNAIRWCFFGKALGRNLKEIGPYAICNIDAAKEGDWKVEVALTFEDNGHVYDLRRTMEPKEMIYKPKNDNDLIIVPMMRKDGNVVRGDLVAHEINQIMPEDIARFFLFDGELLQEYEMLLDSKDQDGQLIKDSIEKILGVPALINARTEIEVLLREARRRQTRDSLQIESVKSSSDKLQKLENDFEILERDNAELHKQLSTCLSEMQELDQELSQSQSVLAGKEKLDHRKSELKRCETRIDDLKAEKLLALKESWKDILQPLLRQRIVALESKRDHLNEAQRKKTQIETKIGDLEKILKFSSCPTCEQDIQESRRENVGTQLGNLEIELKLFKSEFETYGELAEELSKLHKIKPTGATDAIPRFDKELRELNLRTSELDTQVAELEAQLRSHDTSEIAKKKAKHLSLLKISVGMENDIKSGKLRMEENERDQKKLRAQIESNADARAQKSTRVVNTYVEMKEIFSDSIDALRENLRQTVADLSSEAFSKLTTEPTYKRLSINDSYGLTIIDRDNREVVQRSAGAEQIVALSLIDGLNRTARKTGPIIMDTPLGRLDLKHRERVLRYLPEMGEQVILLVHEGEIEKSNLIDSLKSRIGKVYNIERISSSESRIMEG